MEILEGDCKVADSIAYVPQQVNHLKSLQPSITLKTKDLILYH